MTWKPIASNLREARGEIHRLAATLHYLEFGDLPERYRGRGVEYWCEKRFGKEPYSQGALFVSMEHAYHHLNWAVNCRNEEEGKVWRFSDDDAKRWDKFPTDAAFASLWPPPSRRRGKPREILGGCGKVSLAPVRADIEMARIKMDALCWLVDKELGVEGERPEGLKPGVGVAPLSEADFLRRVRSVYIDLNAAWNSRRDDWRGGFEVTPGGVRRRMKFPRVFASGCWNMWPE